jgi:hypothetical protein
MNDCPIFTKIRGVVIKECIVHPMMERNEVLMHSNGVVFYGPGTDLQLAFYEMNLTAADRRFLASIKVKVDMRVSNMNGTEHLQRPDVTP